MPGEILMQLDNKVVAVTGGFGNLGMAVGRVIAAQGARIALIDRAPAPAAGTPPGALLLGGVNLSSLDEAQAAVASIVEKFGQLDGLVNIAGTFRFETLEQGNLEAWDFLHTINLKTAVAASKAALPPLLRASAGRIVNIGAAAAAKAGAGMGPYAASKAGVARLTEALSEEVKDRGITVNAVLPSVIDTPQNRKDMPAADFSRWVTPEAIADVIVFLLSDGARAITGASIPVAGRM
jgi:NAD(P)-dependent dehydrogenase (short-subunit alcohol dehydrogenase family)